MANNETTTKFKVDISELKKAMQDAKRQISVTNSEFKAISSSMDDWATSTDGISAKLKQLDSNLKSQKTILSSLEAQYEAVVVEQGEGSAAADRLKIAINNQKSVINKTEREISNFKSTLEDVSEAEKTAAKTGKSVAETLDDMAKEAEDAEDGFTVLKGAVATFAGNALTSLVGGIRDGISSIMGLAESTREYREDLAKLETAYKTAGLATEDANKVYKDFYAVLGEEDRSVEAVGHLAKFADTQEDLTKWTTIATGVWGTFGDSLPIEGLTEAANETMKTGQLTGALADALNWAGVNEDTFQSSLDKCSTEQERQALITDTLNGLYSDAANNYRETNKSVMEANKANSDYTDTLALMGEKIEPVTTSLKVGFTDLLQELLKLVGDVDMEAFTSKIEEGFSVLKDEVLPAVKEGLGWILDNKDELIAGLAGIAAGFVAFKVVTLIQGVVSAMQGMTVAQYALNLAMSLNPIGLVVAAIVGLVAAFVVLWNKSDSFRNFWINLWEKVKTLTGNAVKSIGKFFTETLPAALDKMGEHLKQLPTKMALWLANTILKVSQWASNMITKAKETASNFVSRAVEYISQLPSKIWTWLSGAISKVSTFGSNLAAKGKEAAQGLLNNIVNIAKGIPDKLKSIGSDIISGLWSGISGAVSGLYDNIKSSLSGLVDKAKDALGIHSPSKVFAEEVGKWIPEGIAVGIDKNAKSALNSIRDMTYNGLSAARSGLSETGTAGVMGGVVNNFYQTNNSPKALSRLEIYRQSKNLLGYAGGV